MIRAVAASTHRSQFPRSVARSAAARLPWSFSRPKSVVCRGIRTALLGFGSSDNDASLRRDSTGSQYAQHQWRPGDRSKEWSGQHSSHTQGRRRATTGGERWRFLRAPPTGGSRCIRGGRSVHLAPLIVCMAEPVLRWTPCGRRRQRVVSSVDRPASASAVDGAMREGDAEGPCFLPMRPCPLVDGGSRSLFARRRLHSDVGQGNGARATADIRRER